MSVHQVHCFYFAQIAIIIGRKIASLGKSDLLMEHSEMKYQISVEKSKWLLQTSCLDFVIQLWHLDCKRLLNKPYENEVTLRGHNIPLKYYQPFKIFTQFNKCIDFFLLKIWGCKATSQQMLRMIGPRAYSTPGWPVPVGPGPVGKFFHETSNFESWWLCSLLI